MLLVGFIKIFVLEPARAFKKARGLWNDSGPGLIGLWAYVVRAQHQAQAHGLGPRPVPASNVAIRGVSGD